jgi:hypothetical protein
MAERKSNRGGQNFKNLTDQRFGRLIAIARGPDIEERNGTRRVVAWTCKCDCGATILVRSATLMYGTSRSCGCQVAATSKRKAVDIIGQRFGRLTVVSRAGSTNEGKACWNCRCECGQTITAQGKDLRTGHTKSCGCWRRYITGEYARIHGMKNTPEYRSWSQAKGRCNSQTNESYERYGGRGITMAYEWENSFEAFYAHIGPRPAGHTLDRIDNEKGYQPGNVRWATPTQQSNNRRPRRWRRRPV